MKRLSSWFLPTWIFPKRCLCCRKFIKEALDLCSFCQESWSALKPSRCTLCLYPFGEDFQNHLCGDCLAEENGFEKVMALGLYQESLKDLILGFKFQGRERLGDFFAQRFSEACPEADVILPVPLHPKKLRQRGYNQSAVIAKRLSRIRKIAWSPSVLKKIKETLPQSELRGTARRKNLQGAFIVTDREKISGKRVLLIDDVYTTGTTVREASKQLLKQGAKSVTVFVIARAT